MKRSLNKLGKYAKTKTKNYYVDTKDDSTLDGLGDIQIEGFKITELKYIYHGDYTETSSNMSYAAIDDAERKAKSICKKIGKSLGKILNIEDKSSGCCDLGEEKTSVTSKKYTVTITYELLD